MIKSLIFNGQQKEKNNIDLENLYRGFYYGDGFFETMYFDGREIRNKDLHVLRVIKALNIYGFDIQGEVRELLDNRIAMVVNGKPQRLKWTFWRTGKGTYLAEENNFNDLFEGTEINQVSIKEKKASIYKKFKVHFSPISRFKTLECSVYNFAARYMKEKGLDDVILLGKHQSICEALYSNIFWIKENIVYTPDITTGCIEGTMRSSILNTLEKEHIKFELGHFSIEDLMNADSIFTCNALKIEYIVELDGKTFSNSHEIIELIKQQQEL